MKTTNIRIRELRKEIENLDVMREEAKSEWNQHSDQYLYHQNKAAEAEKRMLDLNDQIEYRKAEITELEGENGPVLSGIA